ncbi:MAG: adenylate/guanylate cyclase domain-containing protein, partial [Gemmataceae bacterium]|nr:adenylate/guanylate cyclase domain-containing protein [Gemmataceae bacterium]
TFWEEPGSETSSSESLSGVETVVAAPILNGAGGVIGALYGERHRSVRAGQQSLGTLEARLVELLARIVAGGLARVEEEQRAASANSMLEQFFGPDLARTLREQPGMLEGRDRDVSILFCDIRGFSRISERLEAAQTIGWCRDVLGRFSRRVMDEGGVVVDYVGDGLMAMWGAPGEQPDHAERACRAALAILDELPGLNARWQELLREPMDVGLGVNTGTAQVGNVGSQHKFKYGAMGTPVNVASRVQDSTKRFKCQVLITGETASLLGEGYPSRKLGAVKVNNIKQPVVVHQVFPRGHEQAQEAKEEYEKALAMFEREEYGPAARALGNWRGQARVPDEPALVLLYRAVRAMVEGKPAGHPVWEFTEK